MRYRHRWLLSALGIAAGIVAAGCGSDSGTAGAGGSSSASTSSTASSSTSVTSSSSSSSSTGAGGAMGMIPDPGTKVGADWTDVEPNDQPSQAVPVGILNGPVWAGFAMPVTAVSSPTDVDYFVFSTSDAASLANVNIQLCWTFMGNLLDLYLYQVVNKQQGPLVASATQTMGSCETVVAIGQGPTLLMPNTIYLLEVKAGPGLNLNGDPGLYMA